MNGGEYLALISFYALSTMVTVGVVYYLTRTSSR